MDRRSRDEETQQYDEEYSDDDFLEAIDECVVASTTNVADAIGCGRTTAHRRLIELEEQGEIESEKVRDAKVWILADVSD